MKRRVAAAVVAAMAGAPANVYAKPPKPAHHAQTHQDAPTRARAGTGKTPQPGARRPSQALLGPLQGLSKAHAARKACQPYAAHIRAAEQAKGLPLHTLTALGFTESRCDPKAENQRTRARGWGQFVPSGAAAVGRIQRARGETPWFTYARTLDPVASIHAAADLLAFGLELCGGLAEAIRMYNTGKCGKPNAFSRAVMRLAAAIRFVTEIEEPRT
jgi:hypothetical protein